MTATRRTAKRRTACAACLLGLAASATAQAPSVSDVSKVLGNSNTLNGGVLSLRPFNVQFLANSSHAVISLTIAKPLASIGYAAIGTGNSMASADMLVMWPYSGQWYASHRTVDVGHNPPQEASVPSSSDLAYSSALSSNSSTSTTVSFVRALKPAYSTTASAGSAFNLNAVNGMIYAYSSTNPGTSNTAEADLSRHDNNMYGVTSIDLSQSVAVAVASSSSSSSSPTATSTGGATSSAQTSGTSTQSAATQLATQTPSFTSEGVDGAYTNILVAHGIVGAITWAIVSPGMVMLATYGRQWSSWIRMHKWVQLVGTVALTAVTVALASVAVNKNGGVHLKGGHQVTGIVLLILLV
ncbi:Deoxycytidine monophosphate (dCMP) deaminase [Cystobasidiomycetes sp. EMM_F5]